MSAGFLGFLGGAASGALGIIDRERKAEEEERMMRLRDELDMKKQVALERIREDREMARESRRLEQMPQELKIKSDAEAEAAESARTKKVGLINSQLEKNADADTASKFADPVMGDTPLTTEQQSVLDQGMTKNVEERNKNKADFMANSRNKLNAEVESGYEKTSTLAGMDTKEQIAAAKNASYLEKLQYMQDKADKDRASKELLATLRTIGGGEGKDSAKIKTANVYLDTVNKERAKDGKEPLSFEEAFKIANYAPKEDGETKGRQRIAQELIAKNSYLAEEPEKLKAAIDAVEKSIKGDAKPAPGGRKVGDTQIVQAGPNKGKTARWDGTGWVLQ